MPEPYATRLAQDMAGNLRGADGYIDKGALEYPGVQKLLINKIKKYLLLFLLLLIAGCNSKKQNQPVEPMQKCIYTYHSFVTKIDDNTYESTFYVRGKEHKVTFYLMDLSSELIINK